jgi:hypothetical protein
MHLSADCAVHCVGCVRRGVRREIVTRHAEARSAEWAIDVAHKAFFHLAE